MLGFLGVLIIEGNIRATEGLNILISGYRN